MVDKYVIKVTNKVDNVVVGYVKDEVFNGVVIGTLGETIANEYYYRGERGYYGAVENAKRLAKKFSPMAFGVVKA